VRALREENSEVAAPGCEAVQKELGVCVTNNHTMGDVPVQWVEPQVVSGSEVILYLFGGGFIVGCPEDDVSISARLAHMLGRRLCAPKYRLAPEHPYPAARDDVMAVFEALSDSSTVILIGESAGGNLALGLLLDIAAAGLVLPKAVALLSPYIDLTFSGDSHCTLEGLDPTLSVKYFLEPASYAYAGSEPREHPKVSPLWADIPSSLPPTIISTATRDLLLSDSVRLAAKLRAKDVTVELQIAEGLWHVFEWYPELPEAAESLQAIANFLNRYTSTG